MPDVLEPLIPALQIVWINVLLSGDNAVVIALACRDLEAKRRRWAIALGSLVAIVLRIVFTIFVVELLKLPFVRVVSGILLLWIAIQLMRGDDEKEVGAASSLWGAVRTIALADAIMSLDNVVAVAAAARNSLPLIIFGIAASVPLIVFGSTIVLKLLKRFPLLVVAGAVLLGWVAGEMIVSEPRLAPWIERLPHPPETWGAAAGALLIALIALGLHLFRARPHREI